MDVRLIAVPYHLGRPRVSAGRGPDALLATGARQAVADLGVPTQVETIEQPDESSNEIGAAFGVNRLLAARVRAAVAAGAFPLVLAGNCNSCLGTLAGLGVNGIGIVWFDAHADFNTPETTGSGFFEGMALAAATGGCWQTLRESIPGATTVAEDRVVLVGVRSVDPAEGERLERSEVRVVEPARVREEGMGAALGEPLDRLRERTGDVYLHLDLDALDPAEGQANSFAAPGGLSAADLEKVVRLVGERFTVRGAAITAYDPVFDPDGRVARAALGLIDAVVRAAEGVRSKVKG